MQQIMYNDTIGNVHSNQPNVSREAWLMKSMFLLLKRPKLVTVLGKRQFSRSDNARLM